MSDLRKAFLAMVNDTGNFVSTAYLGTLLTLILNQQGRIELTPQDRKLILTYMEFMLPVYHIFQKCKDKIDACVRREEIDDDVKLSMKLVIQATPRHELFCIDPKIIAGFDAYPLQHSECGFLLVLHTNENNFIKLFVGCPRDQRSLEQEGTLITLISETLNSDIVKRAMLVVATSDGLGGFSDKVTDYLNGVFGLTTFGQLAGSEAYMGIGYWPKRPDRVIEKKADDNVIIYDTMVCL